MLRIRADFPAICCAQDVAGSPDHGSTVSCPRGHRQYRLVLCVRGYRVRYTRGRCRGPRNRQNRSDPSSSLCAMPSRRPRSAQPRPKRPQRPAGRRSRVPIAPPPRRKRARRGRSRSKHEARDRHSSHPYAKERRLVYLRGPASRRRLCVRTMRRGDPRTACARRSVFVLRIEDRRGDVPPSGSLGDGIRAAVGSARKSLKESLNSSP